MAHKTKKCVSCNGTGRIKTSVKMDDHGEQCTSCEGTGVVLFDEEFDNIHNLYIDDDSYFEEEDDDR